MSCHTRCNYCTLRDMEKVAERGRGEVVLRPAPHEGMPDGVDVLIRYPNEDEPVWCAWLMKLSDHCVC